VYCWPKPPHVNAQPKTQESKNIQYIVHIYVLCITYIFVIYISHILSYFSVARCYGSFRSTLHILTFIPIVIMCKVDRNPRMWMRNKKHENEKHSLHGTYICKIHAVYICIIHITYIFIFSYFEVARCYGSFRSTLHISTLLRVDRMCMVERNPRV
jgi:hypothetical protein